MHFLISTKTVSIMDCKYPKCVAFIPENHSFNPKSHLFGCVYFLKRAKKKANYFRLNIASETGLH